MSVYHQHTRLYRRSKERNRERIVLFFFFLEGWEDIGRKAVRKEGRREKGKLK